MRVHYLQHVPFEGIGAIEEWARDRSHALSGTELYRQRSLPSLDEMDFLVIMGGPMNVYEEAEYPWLLSEKALISSAIEGGKTVLGICLGAQLVADVLGGPVSKGPQAEIGWYPVELTEEGRNLAVFGGFPPRFTALHWHGDTFAIPPGAVRAASSEACPNQAFVYDGGRVVGLQFHLEETRRSLDQLVAHAGSDLVEGPWIASPAELLSPNAPFAECHDLLFALLDSMVRASTA